MTVRGDRVRVLLYGCSHKPLFSAMSAPKTGDEIVCYTCGRKRQVIGMFTTWARARIECQQCDFTYQNNNEFGKKRMMGLALRHASARLHKVDVIHDGKVDTVKPEGNQQLSLIHDLQLP